MGVRTAQDNGVEQAGQFEVIHVGGDPFDETRILDPFHGFADVACGLGGGHKIYFTNAVLVAAYSSASMICE